MFKLFLPWGKKAKKNSAQIVRNFKENSRGHLALMFGIIILDVCTFAVSDQTKHLLTCRFCPTPQRGGRPYF